MDLILITGGARSGKSRYAEAVAHALGGDAVTYVATAAAWDDEMARRIALHRQRRPSRWCTLEAPGDAGVAVRGAASAVVLLDCLAILASNALLAAEGRGEEAAVAAVLGEVDGLLEAAAGRGGTLIVVSNEVGFGVVPPTPLGRWFRDALGLANQRVAAAARDVVLTVAGIPMVVKGSLPG